MNKTLFEQYLEDIEKNIIKTYGNIVASQILDGRYEHLATEKLIQQSHLNAIDCMIAFEEGEIYNYSNSGFAKVMLGKRMKFLLKLANNRIGHLKEQRNLIENHE